MKINILEKKVQVDPEIRAYAEKKISKLDKFFRQESEASAVFSYERGRCRVEVTLKNNGMFFRASELTSDMRASLDSACALIERQIRKNKTRLEKRLREGALDRDAAPDYIPAEEEAEEEEKLEIVRTKRFSFKPMTPEEAVLQMNLLEHEFFAFRNREDDEHFAVVYRRKNGGYGLITATDVEQ